MKYKCLIIDDEDLARELIETHLANLTEFELVASLPSAIAARKILQNESIDLLFLDIEMPLLKGTDFFKNLVNKPAVIFTTAYRDYALDGFDLNAVDYLLKPVTFQRFLKATDKFLNLKSKSSKPVEVMRPVENVSKRASIFIRKDRKQVKVFLDEIQYIESLKDYVKIVLHNDSYVVKYSLLAIMKLLDDRFLRIHRSFIINMDKVTAYTKQDVELGDRELPIGDSYKEEVYGRFGG